MKSKHLVLFTLFAMNLVDQPAPEVTIEQGILSGKVSDDGSFFEYLGIPYASTNSSTRFQAPQPPLKWEGVLKATEEFYQCPQNTVLGVVGMEDCLKINVFKPSVTQHPLPVMVYIHGGAFILGNGGKLVHGADFLIKHDVILVTFNYRLGILGFLCLGTKQAPGNAGLKDQVAALRWVKKNISAFGGDPENITIFGHSAGGTSVSLLVASDITNGLFNRAIIQSGSSLTNWALSKDPVSVASSYAKLLGRNIKDLEKLYDLFSEKSYKDLISITAKKLLGSQLDTTVWHLPCVEKEIPGEESFMTDSPFNLINNNPKNVSLMYASMNKEGLFFVAEETDERLEMRNKNNLISDDLIFESKKEEAKIAEAVKKYYFGDQDVSKKTLMNLSELYTDLYFEMPMLLEAEIMAQKTDTPIFIYHFTYAGGRNMVKEHVGFNNETGACHGDDILYIFNGKIWPYKIRKADQKIIDFLTKTITNFAKYGDPTPYTANELPVKWLPSDKNEWKFLYIGDEIKMGPMPKPNTFQFWKNIYSKYRRL